MVTAAVLPLHLCGTSHRFRHRVWHFAAFLAAEMRGRWSSAADGNPATELSESKIGEGLIVSLLTTIISLEVKFPSYGNITTLLKLGTTPHISNNGYYETRPWWWMCSVRPWRGQSTRDTGFTQFLRALLSVTALWMSL
ncbi:hypothetical protein GUJ93_ZPchr0006g44873 [Zizania palustris]|uniref:Uncharacterized protein n=1 Tax=Zizania palustris TaxID=103762 RepID=A0A8J5T2Q4_ZIZPA|nr:hypothetical protein GUJ93_ZPchr0006g44873 [Zizania palustris]